HVRIPVTAPSTASSITSSATLSATGTSFQVSSAPQTALINDFSVSIAQPSAATVIAGGVATYTAVVTPLRNPINPSSSGFPVSVPLSRAAGSPSGASCSSTNTPTPNRTTGPQSRTFKITPTPRVTTPASLFHSGPTYAIWMPIFGIGLLGAGISRKRRILLGAFLAVVLGIALLQAGCGSSSNRSGTTTRTPAGTYT